MTTEIQMLIEEVRYVREKIDDLSTYIREREQDANEVHARHDTEIALLKQQHDGMLWAVGKVCAGVVAILTPLAGLLFVMAKKALGLE